MKDETLEHRNLRMNIKERKRARGASSAKVHEKLVGTVMLA